MTSRARPASCLATALAALAGLALAPTAAAEISLPAIIGDHMVLQQQADAAIWGWAAPGEDVSLRADWLDGTLDTRADARGRWRLTLPTPAAGGPHTITISGDNTITLRDVLVGEVWIGSGQSNMEMPLGNIRPGYTGVDNAEEEIAAAQFPNIRLFTVENTISAPRRTDVRGTWQPCAPETVRTFSATAYFFGREIHRALDVPVGLVSADWGGTVAQAWTSAEGLASFPEFADELALLEAVQDPARRMQYVAEHQSRWWASLDRASKLDAQWTALDFDDRDWAVMSLPATWSGNDLGSFDGVVAFRRVIDLPNLRAGHAATLSLGPIDDYDDVWVNGVPVGSVHEPGRWQQPRRYDVPAGVLRAGRNVIAVRVLDTGGLGGLNGDAGMLHLGVGDGRPFSLAGDWRYRRGAAMSDLPPMPQGARLGPNLPTVLFNGMIAPLVPYRIRGVIWYQGESNRRNAAQYEALFPALIRDWRREWGQGDFPFYYVQIAPFGYGGDTGQTAALRDAQARAMALPNTGMAVTLDIGDPRDIHPTNKQEVGRRLALWALAQTYGRSDVTYSGPLFRSARVDGRALRIRFDHAGGGLVLRDAPAGLFEIAGADGAWVPADAAIDGDELVLLSPQVPAPRGARYAWSAAPTAALFNREGLPAAPFRTEGD